MRMSDVEIGMRLVSTTGGFSPITVTALTERGFTYRLDHDTPLIPRLGMIALAEGGEHYGLNGEAFYEPERNTP